MNKYHNKKSRCLSKHIHDSKMEAAYCDRLLARVQNQEILGYEVQVPFELKVEGVLICTHVVDFLTFKFVPDGQRQIREEEVHEVKGCELDVWKIKRNLFKVLYPKIKYIVVKQEKRSRPWMGKILRKIRRR